MSNTSGSDPRVVWSEKLGAFVPVDPATDDGGVADPDDAVRAIPRPTLGEEGPAHAPEQRDASRARAPSAPEPAETPSAPRRRHYVIGEGAGGPVRQAPAPPSAAPPPKAEVSDRAGRAPSSPRPAKKAAPPSGTGDSGGRRWPWRRIVGVALVAVVLLPVLLLGFAWWQFNRIERVDVGDSLSSGAGAGTNYLIVGSDSREGIEQGDPNADAFIGSTVTGERTDTIMVLRMQGDQSYLLSIPRDLWVTSAATGEEGRINAVYRSGPGAFIETIQQNVGIPIHHYLEIDFVSFGGLVDSVGGITIDFPNPARDEASGLVVDQAGPVKLDGTQALAYVRSRNYTELIDGEWQTDPTGDLGRTERQRQFLSALVGRATASRNPFSLMQMSRSLGGGLAIDDHFTFFGALGLAWSLRGFSPESVVLPTFGRTTGGGASVLEIDEPAAAPVVAQFSS